MIYSRYKPKNLIGMKAKLLLIFLCTLSILNAQKDIIKPIQLNWQAIIPGFDYCETDAPYPSIINDSKLTFVKINPAYFDFELLMGSQHGKKSYTVEQWADSFNLDLVINAGMYDLAKKLHSKAFLKSDKHTNNPNLYPNYNAMIAFNPKDSSRHKFDIVDLKCTVWDKLKPHYNCYAQGLRMLDCTGEALGWDKKKQSCSMLLATKDQEGNIYFVFTRSPYTHNEMIKFLQNLPLCLSHAIYLEGGPQTSLYIDIILPNGENFCVEKVGSYVSETYETDGNNQFWALPNVIGIRVKTLPSKSF